MSTNDAQYDPDAFLRRMDHHSLASEHGTPFFLYDGDGIRDRARSLMRMMGEDVEVSYSIKANPSLGIVALLCSQGLGAEVASLGELVAAKHAGVTPDRICFAGPGKTNEEIASAVSTGISQINAESILEITRIADVAHTQGTSQRVGVRVNISASGDGTESASGKIATSGDRTKFGIDPDRVPDAIRTIVDHESIEFGGLHIMLASQVMNVRDMLVHASRAITFATEIEQELEITIPTLNLGGGLGVAHHLDEASFDLEAFASGLRALIAETKQRGDLTDTRFIIEPGRVLMSDYGFYISRVIDVKESQTDRIAVVDGGIHHAMLPITANKYRTVRLGGSPKPSKSSPITLIGGPLCTSADQWAPVLERLEVESGDFVAMHNCGAYGLSAGMTLFLSRGTPPELLVLDDTTHLIRARSRPEDLLALQRLPEIGFNGDGRS